MANQVAQWESQYDKLKAMWLEFEESMKVGILLSSLMDQNRNASINASIKTLLEGMATWSNVTNTFM